MVAGLVGPYPPVVPSLIVMLHVLTRYGVVGMVLSAISRVGDSLSTGWTNRLALVGSRVP